MTLRSAPLPFSELCTILFEGSTTTGIHGWSPSCTTPRPGASSVATNIDIDSLDDIEDLLGDKNYGASKDSPSQSSILIENKNLGNKRKNTTSRLAIDEKMSDALELLINKNNTPDEEECIKKIDRLGWGESLYSAALSIFCEGDSYKKTWMILSEVDKLENYVRTMGENGGIHCFC
ncbi:uncharacterized protein LOC132602320 [Lycium barbarum]|uniref:uncharacterized protein LOC132602320 n=1 Tax=Lycium barbarum TaxID=112863 RepID=UPI00293EA000|nr:uncharacterized protein LOC132602320 [Lycium barbarum]